MTNYKQYLERRVRNYDRARIFWMTLTVPLFFMNLSLLITDSSTHPLMTSLSILCNIGVIFFWMLTESPHEETLKLLEE